MALTTYRWWAARSRESNRRTRLDCSPERPDESFARSPRSHSISSNGLQLAGESLGARFSLQVKKGELVRIIRMLGNRFEIWNQIRWTLANRTSGLCRRLLLSVPYLMIWVPAILPSWNLQSCVYSPGISAADQGERENISRDWPDQITKGFKLKVATTQIRTLPDWIHSDQCWVLVSCERKHSFWQRSKMGSTSNEKMRFASSERSEDERRILKAKKSEKMV